MSNLDRRGFLIGLGSLTVAGVVPAKARSLIRIGQQPAQDAAAGAPRRYQPVRVSPDRVIRTVAGLRPFRATGFVVKLEKAGPKLVIHNYGHGGAGITLSWGTAALAVEKALETGKRSCAVLGCGAVGLATASLLQRKGFNVTIYAKDLPPETTSNIAGGLWFPASVFDNRREIAPEILEQFNRACRTSHRMFQNLVGDHYGVRWMEYLTLLRQHPGEINLPGGSDLYPEMRIHEDPKKFFGFPYALRYYTMLIEPPVYLNALLRDFYVSGGKVIVRAFRSRRELARLVEPLIVNCTGLGSRDLFGDDELEPDKGQLSVLLPQPEVDYGYVAPARQNVLYMFPRKDGVILGGTNERGNWSLDPSPEESRRILQGHSEIHR